MQSNHRSLRGIAATCIAVLCVGSLLAGCSDGNDDSNGDGDDGNSDVTAADRGEIVTAAVDDVIVPGYEKLAAETAALVTATEALCASPTDETLAGARDAWETAQSAWAHTAAYRFGPIKDLRLLARINYAVDTDKIAKFAAVSAEPVTVDELHGKGADLRGLNAVQYLLFTPATVAELTPRACSYAVAGATLSAAAAEETRAAWVDGVEGEVPAAEQMKNPGEDGMWSDTTEALEDLLNGVLGALTTVVDMQLGPAIGVDGEAPAPQEADGGAAHRLSDDMLDEIAGIEAIAAGADGTGEGESEASGLAALVTAAGAERTAESMTEVLVNATEAISRAGSPIHDLDPAVDTAAMDDLTEAHELLDGLRTTMSTEVASLLGLTVSFSDADGDG